MNNDIYGTQKKIIKQFKDKLAKDLISGFCKPLSFYIQIVFRSNRSCTPF